MIIYSYFLTIRANFAIYRNIFNYVNSIIFSTNRNFNSWFRKIICFEIVIIHTKNFLFRSKIVRHVNCKIFTKQFVLICILFREFYFIWNVSLTSFLFNNKNVFLLKFEQSCDHWFSQFQIKFFRFHNLMN